MGCGLSMSAADTEWFFTFLAYLTAALTLVFMAYLGWRKIRRRHRHRRLRNRSKQHRSTWGWG